MNGQKAFRRSFFGIMTFGIVVLWGIAHLPDTSTKVTSNLDGLEWRQLATTTTQPHALTSGPRATTRATTTTTPAARADQFVVVYAGRAITITRSPLTEQVFRYLDRLTP